MQHPRRSQEGYALLVILLALSVLVIGLSKAAVSWSTQIRREREARMIDHARQYTEAIKRYYHAYGHYPASLDEMLQQDTKGQRYLSQEFLDPLNLADSGKFQLLRYGQTVPAEIVDQVPSAAMSQGQQPGALGGGLSGTQPPQSPLGGTTAGSTPGGLSSGLSGGAGNSGVGAGPIIGVASLSKQPAIHAFNGFDVPDHWQFVYNYATDPSLRRGLPGSVPGPQPQPKPSGGTGIGGGSGNR